MSDSSGQEIVSINDPGEVGREDHNIGDRFVVTISNLVAWAWPALMIAIVSQVILRGAGHNQAWLDDLQWWIYGIAVLIAFGYAVTTNAHVRVDIFFAGFPKERKTRIEIFGLVWLLLPFIILSWDVTFHYAVSSVLAWEGSDSPNGLHNLWILKCLMNLSFAFIGIAIWAAYVRFLEQLTDPDLWKQLLIAFPSTMFLVNLTIYYLMYWFFYVTGGPDMNPRRITRMDVFEWTVLASFVVTVALIAAAYVLRNRGRV